MYKYSNHLVLLNFIFHEFLHLVMAILMYPFGTRISAIKFIGGFNKENETYFEGYVYTTSKYKFCIFMVSSAPFILYWVIYAIFICTSKWLPFPFCILAGSCWLSKIDIRNIKYCIGLSSIQLVDPNSLSININECIRNRPIEITKSA